MNPSSSSLRLASARWAVPVVVAAAALATGMGGAGGAEVPPPTSARASGPVNVPAARPVAGKDRSLATEVWPRLDARRRDDALAALTPEQADRLEELLDAMATGGPVPVASEGRIAGYVDAAAVMDRPAVPADRTRMAPVTDPAGRLVAYWGGPLGVVERRTAEAPGFDPPALAVRRGLNRDGTAGTDLVRRLPAGTNPPKRSSVAVEPARPPVTAR